jgi:hypothetical protein
LLGRRLDHFLQYLNLISLILVFHLHVS